MYCTGRSVSVLCIVLTMSLILVFYNKNIVYIDFAQNYTLLLKNTTVKQKGSFQIKEIIVQISQMDIARTTQESIQQSYEETYLSAGYENMTKCIATDKNKELLMTLGQIVQNRIHHIQNPVDCSKAKKLVAGLTKCGHLGQLHHLMLMLMYGYATNRTVIFDNSIWSFAMAGNLKWEDFYLPLSRTCSDRFGLSVSEYNSSVNQQNIQVLICTDCYLTLPFDIVNAIPVDIANVLVRYHGRPLIWWAGQFMKYIVRLKPWLARHIENKKKMLSHPIVGIHARTTDRAKKLHFNLQLYFGGAENFFRNILSKDVKTFIATDTRDFVKKARKKFPNYGIYTIPENTQTAYFRNTQRMNKASLTGIITDLNLLSHTDYLVCALSSNVAMAALELMQAISGDKSHCVYSLDFDYWYVVEHEPNKVVIQNHIVNTSSYKEELELHKGDLVYCPRKNSKLSNSVGYVWGINKKTKKKGFFPLNKVIDHIQIYKSINYANYDLNI